METVCQLDPKQWADPWWRLCNLYRAVSDSGVDFKFYPNDNQEALYRNLWFLNLILKARQQGFTTFIDLILLDQAIFNANKSCGIIAQTREDAQIVFRNKVQYPYRHLPEGLQQARETETDSTQELVFNNGSKVRVGTSMRSDTLQFLHVSEFGKIAAKYPEKAIEIQTGAFNTIAPGQMIFVESTAEGKGGKFFEMVDVARKLDAQVQGGTAKLTQLDFRFHFFAWWQKPGNVLDPADVVITPESAEYFAKVEKITGTKLSPEQRAWYVKKQPSQRDRMKAEHPSYPDEAFEVAIHGAYYAEEMMAMRATGRIGRVPHINSIPVNTFWDLGANDTTFIWLHQWVNQMHRFIGCYEKAGMGMGHFVKWLQDKPYVYGTHYLPHDVEQDQQGEKEYAESRKDMLEALGLKNVETVPRVHYLIDGINLTRTMLANSMMDETECAVGITALDSYQKEWSERLGDWKDQHLHNWASNGSDAIRQCAQGFQPPAKRTPRRNSSWRTA